MATRPYKPQLPWPRTAPDNPSVQLGIDVVARCKDIENIVKSYFSQKGIPPCHPAEDIIQEILLTIVRQNHTRCALDPRKGSFSHYVWLVASNVCCKMVRKSRTTNRIPAHLISSIEEPTSTHPDCDQRIIDLVAEREAYEINMVERIDLLRGAMVQRVS